jgi:error-prone DNA polymerase
VFAQIEGFGSYGFPESHAASFAHLAYASAWVKRHHPAAFACALLNSQPMGFYAPAQIVRDAREHGVAVRSLDVNASEWDCTLEADRGSAGGLALRLGLRLCAGLAEADGRAVAKARRAGNGAPFGSVEEAARRAGVSRRALEALAAADAFAGIAVPRRGALWQAGGVERTDDLPLFHAATSAASLGDDGPLLPEPAPDLPPQRGGEEVVEDYTATGLTLRAHPLALLRPALDALGLDDTRCLSAARPGTRIRLPGLVLMRQRPGTAKGVVFVTVEDEFGSANLVVYADVGVRDRRALVGARLLVAEGRLERETDHAEVPITHLICWRLKDRSDLLDGLSSIDGGDNAWAGRALGRADEVRRPEPGSGQPQPPAKLPPSRDFR